MATWSMVAVLLLMHGSSLAAQSDEQVTPDTAITLAERKGLRVEPDSIWHPALGFSLPNPGKSFRRDSALEEVVTKIIAGNTSMAAWALMEEDQTRAVLIVVTRAGGLLDESRFRDFAKGILEGASGSTTVSEELTWLENRGEYRAMLQHPNGVYMGVRCLSAASENGLIACIETITPEFDELESVAAGLRLWGSHQ